MKLSKAIIKIHSIASGIHGELEADELITSLLIVIINKLKDSGELTPLKLASAFDDVYLEQSLANSADKTPKLYLVPKV